MSRSRILFVGALLSIAVAGCAPRPVASSLRGATGTRAECAAACVVTIWNAADQPLRVEIGRGGPSPRPVSTVAFRTIAPGDSAQVPVPAAGTAGIREIDVESRRGVVTECGPGRFDRERVDRASCLPAAGRGTSGQPLVVSATTTVGGTAVPCSRDSTAAAALVMRCAAKAGDAR